MRYVRKIILPLLIVCVGGAAIWLLNAPPAADSDAKGAPDQTASMQPPCRDAATPEPPAPGPRMEIQDDTVDSGIRAVSFPEQGQVCVDDLAAALILDRRITALDGGVVSRLFLVNGGGELPFHRIEETLQFDEGRRQYVVASQRIIVADHFLVKLRDGQPREALEELNRRFGARIVRETGFPNKFLVQLAKPSLDGVPDAIAAYEKETGPVERAHANSIVAPMAIPNDTNWSSLWDKQRIGCPEAWDTETGSTNIIIAIIDTGVDLDHPDLAAHIWRNPGEIPGDGIDNDGNGLIDDWIGWDWGKNDNNPDDNGDEDYDGTFAAGGHGTHCAGIAGAIGNNSTQVAGVCWNVTIMVLKPFEYMSAYKEMRTTSLKAEEAIKYAANKGAKVTSNSYGGSGSGSDFYDGISYLNNRGVLFVAAAGNSGQNNDAVPHQPSNVDLPNVIAVASSTSSESLSGFSNYGAATVDLAAPGSSILSTVSGGGTASKNGTSMACPQVAGAIALLYSAKPDLSYLDCKKAIFDGVDKFSAYSGKCVTGGRLNVSRSLDLLGPIRKYPYSESFESGCGRWSPDTGSVPWLRISGPTPISETGPSAAADGSHYLYVAGGGVLQTAKLQTVFDFSALSAPQIEWSYHMYGANIGDLYLEASTNGSAWISLWSLSGNQGDQWYRTNVSLQAYAGLTNVQIRFRYYLSNFFGQKAEAALDFVRISQGTPPSGGDLDGDGLPDDWEAQYFGGPTNASASATASNGVNTVMECYIAGLDPTDPSAALRVSILCLPEEKVIEWNVVSGRVYSVYWTTNLLAPFLPLETNVVPPRSSCTDAVHRTGRFYKIGVRLAE